MNTLDELDKVIFEFKEKKKIQSLKDIDFIVLSFEELDEILKILNEVSAELSAFYYGTP